jgi:predicted Na+-dependent transporter
MNNKKLKREQLTKLNLINNKVLFPHNPQMGIILLPIMMYHALQLITVSIIAQWYARSKTENLPHRHIQHSRKV